MSDDAPDRSGPRRYVPVPGLLDIDAVEDANVADVFGEDEPDDADRPAPVVPATEPSPPEGPSRPDPLSLPPPPPLGPGPLPATEAPAPAPDAGGAEPATEPDSLDDEAEALAEPTPPSAPDLSADRSDGDPATGETSDTAPPAEKPAEVSDEPAADETGDTEAGPPDAGPEPSIPPTSAEPLALDAHAEPAALLPAPEVVATAKTATRSRGRELVQLVLRYGKAHVPEQPAKASAADTGPPRMVGRVGQLIPFLRVIPWVLAALFALSFWWDFPGQAVTIAGRTIAIEGLMRVLTVSGLIGFGTNWLAITMLFQPREKRAIIPQGLIPAQRERVIYRLSEAISRELINADIIKQRIQESGVIGRYRDLALGVVRGVVEDPGFRADLKTLAQEYAQEVVGSDAVRREVARLAVEKVEEQAGQGLGGVALRLYRTFAEDDFQRRIDRALDELPSAVVPLLDRIDAALDAVPEKVEARADEIEEAATRAVLSFVEGFDVRTMIAERARQFDEGQLEGLLKSTSNEQLNYIKYLGAILGVFGGFVIWEPLGALAVFVTIGLVLWAADEALVRMRR